MTLYLIGLGLNDEKDISVKGFEKIKECSKIYLEAYTSILQVSIKRLERFYGKKIIRCDREAIEIDSDNTILKEAKEENIAVLVVGDPFGATTHADLFMRAKEKNIEIRIIHNASIMNSVGEVGLELYKFGKTTSIPFPEKGYSVDTPYDTIKSNKKSGLHTLVLLDLRPEENRFMTINQAIERLTNIEGRRHEKVFTKETWMIGCARIGDKKAKIIYGTAEDLHKADFGKPPHCIIIPGKLHFFEEEMLDLWKKKDADGIRKGNNIK